VKPSEKQAIKLIADFTVEQAAIWLRTLLADYETLIAASRNMVDEYRPHFEDNMCSECSKAWIKLRNLIDA
jgi:hypothetical protein